MKKQRASRVFRLSRSLKRLGRSVGRCNRKSIALQAVQDKRICMQVVKFLGTKSHKRNLKNVC